MKRFASHVAAAGAVAVVAVSVLAGGVATATTAASSSLPTLTLALNGKSVTVGGRTVSGAVNVVTTVTGEKQGGPVLIRLNPGVSFAAFAQATAAIRAHHGDLNYLNPFGSVVFSTPAGRGTSSAQTVLQPGNYFALDTGKSGGKPPHAAFTVIQSVSPATLPTPGATVSMIEFSFGGPRTLHHGELVRSVNAGFLVHMDVFGQVKNLAAARKVVALLRAGKDNAAGRLFIGAGGTFAGPVSSGSVQQEVVTAKPGIYVQACFMNTQDGREHTRLGMERIFRITK
ncbi:MAG: hypothetical protein M3018_06730 [Actinomycetota bacterium]|nr:hypothetical protein [Actinomycetota bacterium]